MSLLIQKFGGSSLATVAHIQNVAKIIKASCDAGHRVVAVVSAMGDETDHLLTLMHQLTDTPHDREYAALLTSGEQVSSALLSMALSALGVMSQSYQAFQIQLRTQDQYRKSRVASVDARMLLAAVDNGSVPVIAGFQGINEQSEITTLGRGGSDITAVALAAFLQADECQIFTDVDGVYSADPRTVTEAELINEMHYDEMLAFAQLGAKVLQTNSVEMARKYNVPVRVLSSVNPSRGTLIHNVHHERAVSGIACVAEQVKVTVRDLTHADSIQVLQHMRNELIEHDMLSQNHKSEDQHDMSFAMSENELRQLCQLTHDFHIQTGMAKISLVGQGMQMHAGVAASMMQLLSEHDISIHSISSTTVQVSILIDADVLVHCMQLLHGAFKMKPHSV